MWGARMDNLDYQILTLLSENARATVKQIAAKVALTSPAVSQRIRRLEADGVIAGYTLRLNPALTQKSVNAIISIYIQPAKHQAFNTLLLQEPAVEECYHVTGSQSHMVKVCCRDIEALNDLIGRIQTLGQTNTQIILSTIHGQGTGLQPPSQEG